ncbi:MAG: orotate phosphoribosyltransferase [Sphingobacteriia bacterium]|nr:orotate phosphoribosyltransferase [Sphingobacteriia bacterium]
MKEEEVFNIFQNYQAILKGHFILTSGHHSEMYVQCAKIMSHANVAAQLCKELANKVKEQFGENAFDVIVSPAMGGVLVGFEVSKHFDIPNYFCERVNGKLELRRNFKVNPNDRVLIIEDVISTGKSSLETFEVVEALGGNIIAEACLVNRSAEKKLADKPIVSLLNLYIPTYDKDSLPEHLKDIPVLKPGSRFINNPIREVVDA